MEHVHVETRGPVTVVTLQRPEVMNAINGQMHDELEAAFNGFADDPQQYVCIVTGAGEKAFCAGSDLKAVARNGGHPVYPAHGYAGLIERFDCAKPIIAAVNGLALGGGFEIALACDLIIASDQASFGLPEPLVGAIAFGGGLHRLPRAVGTKRALDLILTGRRVDAAEGLRLGFVNAVVPQAEVMDAAHHWAGLILRGSPMAIRASKEVVYSGLDEPSLARALARQSRYPAYAAWREAEDTKEGPIAFAEKRPPRWLGR